MGSVVVYSFSLVTKAPLGIKVSTRGPESVSKYIKTLVLDKMEDHGQERRRPEENPNVKTGREIPEKQV